jgi:hypothetical protein
MNGTIDVAGAVDLHAHCGPSIYNRRVDGYEFAREAAAAGMDAVVMKEHHLPTVYGVSYIERQLERDGHDIDVFGSVVLNYCNGGFNPFAVQAAIDYGAKVVWAPTVDARHHAAEMGKPVGQYGDWISDGDTDLAREYEGAEGLFALDDEGDLTDDVRLCLDKVVDADVVFAVGHLSNEETEAIVEYLADQGHEKIVVDHPTFFVTDLGIDQQRRLAEMGAVMNFVFCGISPKSRWHSNEHLYETIRAVGVDNCVVSSDMGQIANPSSPEGLRILGEILLQEGLSEAEYTRLVEHRPKALLDL